MSGVVDVWCGGCLVWWMSGVVDVWCGGCPILLIVWWMSGVVVVWCGGCPILPMVWWMSGVVDVWCGGCLCGGCRTIASFHNGCNFGKLWRKFLKSEVLKLTLNCCSGALIL